MPRLCAGCGLSPLVRGTRFNDVQQFFSGRFIPAGAGNTDHGVQNSDQDAVYPRWRGEHCNKLFISRTTCGLSPLARGTHEIPPAALRNMRFIPAGAGNTKLITFSALLDPVYPRWRGEHGMIAGVGRLGTGLSPLARGTPPVSVSLTLSRRFIPAGAGNTGPGRG